MIGILVQPDILDRGDDVARVDPTHQGLDARSRRAIRPTQCLANISATESQQRRLRPHAADIIRRCTQSKPAWPTPGRCDTIETVTGDWYWKKTALAIALMLAAVAGFIFLVWRATESREYVNERVATCTIIKKELADLESFPPAKAVITTPCGKLTFQQGPTRGTGELYRRLEIGHTYRLRITDIRPASGEAAVAIAGIEGEL
jgi:hypothetical protein